MEMEASGLCRMTAGSSGTESSGSFERVRGPVDSLPLARVGNGRGSGAVHSATASSSASASATLLREPTSAVAGSSMLPTASQSASTSATLLRELTSAVAGSSTLVPTDGVTGYLDDVFFAGIPSVHRLGSYSLLDPHPFESSDVALEISEEYAISTGASGGETSGRSEQGRESTANALALARIEIWLRSGAVVPTIASMSSTLLQEPTSDGVSDIKLPTDGVTGYWDDALFAGFASAFHHLGIHSMPDLYSGFWQGPESEPLFGPRLLSHDPSSKVPPDAFDNYGAEYVSCSDSDGLDGYSEISHETPTTDYSDMDIDWDMPPLVLDGDNEAASALPLAIVDDSL